MEQLSIFDFLRENYKLNIDKPIKLIEMFAGYGSQALALKYLGIPFEHHKICEWAVPSIQAYKDLHFANSHYDYSMELQDHDSLNKILFEYGISTDYNQPMTLEQIQKKPYEWKKQVYNNIKTTHNLVNIMSVKGKELDFNDNFNQTVILTYSFPCQDLSLAGKMKGMKESQANGDTGTRSGLLWEIERILAERERENLPLPNVLLMENVPQVIGQQNVEDFNKWQLRLEKFGYSNYHELLNAKDYGIPQNRNRCFMISLLGDYNYRFPHKKKLKLKLKNLLESDVDEKYYLTQKQIENINSWNAYEKPLETMEKVEQSGISPTLTTRSGRMKHHRGTVQKGMSQTISTAGGNNIGVVIKKDTKNYIEWEEPGKLDIDCRAYKEDEIAPTTTTTPKTKVLLNNLRIRKLTPKECWRLMGVKDEDYDKVKPNQSESSMYHLAGDSIVVNVLEEIFKQLL